MADISQITVDGVTYDIKDLIARAVASSKTTVTVGSALSSGTQIATITVDGTPYIIYAPAPSQNIDLGELYDQLGSAQSHIQEIIYTIYGYDRTAFSTLSVEEALSILADIGAYYPDIQVSLGSGTPIATISDGHSTTTLYAPTPPSPYTSNPVMDGTASPGSSANYARGDHKHPTDTSRQATLVSGTNIKTVNGNSLLGSGDLSISGTIHYGECSTAGATAAKTVSISNFTSSDLVAGAMVLVKFTAANGVANPTLNVSGTGAKAIRRHGTTAAGNSAGTSWNAGAVVCLIYDGTAWYIEGWINTTYSTISQANIENLTGTSAGLITGQRLTQGVAKRVAKKASLFSSTRQASANLTADGETGITHFLGTSTMTTGKPNTQDGHIVHMAWDNTGGWDSQIYQENGATPRLYIRNQTSGTWGSWVKVLSDNMTPYVTNQGTVSGGWMYRVWSNNFQEVWFRGTVTYTSAGVSYQGWYRSVQNITIPISSMTGMSAFADDATAFASGADNAHIHTCAGVRTNGTQFEAQTLGMNAIAANTATTGWSVYIAGYKR